MEITSSHSTKNEKDYFDPNVNRNDSQYSTCQGECY